MPGTNNSELNNEDRFTFGDHLEELRKRLIFCIIAVIFCFIVCWIFKSTILIIAKRPHLIAMNKFGLPDNLQVLSYQEGFYAYIKLCFISSIFLSYPITIFQIWQFVNPGLIKKEKRFFVLFIFISFLAFGAGTFFGYFFLIPLGLQFLIGILGAGIAPIITMGQYISFVFILTIALGFVFQLPLIILIITRIKLLSTKDFISWRRYAILATFIISAVITPPDPFTQILTAIPMLALYETGILISNPTKKRVIIFGSVLFSGIASIILFFLIFTSFSSLGIISDVKGDVVLGSINNNHQFETKVNGVSSAAVKIQKCMYIRTGSNGRITINMNNGIEISLDKETDVKIDSKRLINVTKGQIFLDIIKSQQGFTVLSPNGSTITENGKININVLPHETVVTVVEGSAVLSNGNIEKTIVKGRQDKITSGGDFVNVGDIIEWTE